MMADGIPVTKNNPCPFCGSEKQCLIRSKTGICYKQSVGANRTGTDRRGQTYYVHSLNGQPAFQLPSSTPRNRAAGLASIEIRNEAHNLLIVTSCRLSQKHRESLQARGLTDEQIGQAGFGSLPKGQRWKQGKILHGRFGDNAFGIPGVFLAKKKGSEETYVSFGGAAGIMIPARNAQGLSQAAQVRADEAENGLGKYTWVSSKSKGGVGPGSPPHVPIWVKGQHAAARLTEGLLKADIASAVTGQAFVAVAGVGQWAGAVPVLREIGAKTVALCFDMDVHTNPDVARELLNAAKGLASEGFEVQYERWDPQYKGIDDLLQANGETEVLAGQEAVDAIQAIIDAFPPATEKPAASPDATTKPALDESTLATIRQTLESGGLQSLLSDVELVKKIGRMKVSDKASFAVLMGILREQKESTREFNHAIQPAVREALQNTPSEFSRPDDGGYFVEEGCICREKMTTEGPMTVSICNHVAVIRREVTLDDGEERTKAFDVEVTLQSGHSRGVASVPAKDIVKPEVWLVQKFGGDCVIWAGESRQYFPAVQAISIGQKIQHETRHTHTGWKQIDGQWVYLHAGGAIGATGQVAAKVELQPPLDRYHLPDPPTGDELISAVRSIFKLLDLCTPDIMIPLVAAAFRAVLSECDFSIFIVGLTGTFKSEGAALIQQSFGAGLDSRHLPGSWSSTANALEATTYAAKDAVSVLDDFVPPSPNSPMHAVAERVLRGAGNAAGRQRMRADTSIRRAKHPRGLIIATGEDIPAGHSLRARMLILEFRPGMISSAKLTACQSDAAAGKYASAMAGFIQFILNFGYENAIQARKESVQRIRDSASADGRHARTPSNAAELCFGFFFFLKFAADIGAITEEQRQYLRAKGMQAMLQVADRQADHLAESNPADKFLSLLQAAIASGRCHLADADGAAPPLPGAYGWRDSASGRWGQSVEWSPRGPLVGWITGDDLYLEPDSAYATVQAFAKEQGGNIPVTAPTLWKRMHDKRLLKTADGQRLKARATLHGQRRRVIHLDASCIEAGEELAQSEEKTEPIDPEKLGQFHFGDRSLFSTDSCSTENVLSGPVKSGPLEKTGPANTPTLSTEIVQSGSVGSVGPLLNETRDGIQNNSSECRGNNNSPKDPHTYSQKLSQLSQLGQTPFDLSICPVAASRIAPDLIQHSPAECAHRGSSSGPHWIAHEVSGDGGSAFCLACIPPADLSQVMCWCPDESGEQM